MSKTDESLAEISLYAKRVLNFLKERGIMCVDDVIKTPRQRFGLGSITDVIEVAENFSHGIPSYRISYISPGYGIPLEIVFRPHVGYTHIIAKSTEELEGYTQFGRDDQNKFKQSKVIFILDFKTLKKELEKLKNVNSS